jgi:UDP-2-acetamido-3-amino-2,3-dideoxy-glucuronate N-acetyltransferase
MTNSNLPNPKPSNHQPGNRELPPNVAVAADVELGRDVRLAAFVNLYGCRVGDETTIGAFVEIQRGSSVGRRCKISSHSFVCTGVEIEDEVFVGHGVVFINDRHPRATNRDRSLKVPGQWRMERTIVRRRASIGSGAVIMCGVEIGAGAMVGAGALVTRDVAAGALVAGVPARVRALAAARE